MGREFSIYLDLVRFLAAALVFISHTNQRRIIDHVVPWSGYGPSAVIVFFVLSGFVIAHVLDTKENTWRKFVAGRAARVYSVVVPALVLTLALDSVGRTLHPVLYDYPWDQFVVRTLASLAMANEVWLISITAFSNVPYWSIVYESWYYVMIGLWVFAPARWRWLALAAVGLALGPKVVLLAPIWLAGLLLYHWDWPKRWPLAVCWVMLVKSLAGIVAYHAFDWRLHLSAPLHDWLGPALTKELAFSKYFLGDYVLGVLVWLNFAAMRRVAPVFAALFRTIEAPVRAGAAYTFTLYLMHQPVLLFWAAVLRADPKAWWGWAGVVVLTSATIIAVGWFTEGRRHTLKAMFMRLLSAAAPRAPAASSN